MRKAANAHRDEGLVRVSVQLHPGQLAAVRGAAHERALVNGSTRLDVSAVVREALDAWFKQGRGR